MYSFKQQADTSSDVSSETQAPLGSQRSVRGDSNSERMERLGLGGGQTSTALQNNEAATTGDGNPVGPQGQAITFEFPFQHENGAAVTIEIIYELTQPSASFEAFKTSQEVKLKGGSQALAASTFKSLTWQGHSLGAVVPGYTLVVGNVEFGSAKGDLTYRKPTEWTLAKANVELKGDTLAAVGDRQARVRIRLSAAVPLSALGDFAGDVLAETVDEAKKGVDDLSTKADDIERQIQELESKKAGRKGKRLRAIENQLKKLRRELDTVSRRTLDSLWRLSLAENAATRTGGKMLQRFKPLATAVRSRLAGKVLPRLLAFGGRLASRAVPVVGWALLLHDLVDVTRRLYAVSKGEAEFGFGGGDIDQPKLPMSEKPDADADRADEAVPGTERFEKENETVRRLFDLLTGPGKGEESSRIGAAELATFFEIMERYRGSLTEGKVNHIGALITAEKTSAARMLTKLDLLLGLSEPELAVLAPRPGERVVAVPDTVEALRQRIRANQVPPGTTEKPTSIEEKSATEKEAGDGKGSGGGVGTGGQGSVPGTVPAKEKLRRLSLLLMVGGIELDAAALKRLEPLAEQVTPQQLGALATLDLGRPKSIDQALAVLSELLLLTPEEIRRQGVTAGGAGGLGKGDGKGGGGATQLTGDGQVEVAGGGGGGGKGKGGGGQGEGGGDRVTKTAVAPPGDLPTGKASYVVSVTRREKVGDRVTVSVTVEDKRRWSFTLPGVVVSTQQVRGRTRTTVMTTNASWLLVKHPRYGGIYIKPLVRIEG